MEKAKIDSIQLFILVLLFEMGTSIVLAIGIEAKTSAWITILIGSLFGCLLFQVYIKLFQYYPNDLPTTYTRKIFGKYIGSLISFLYIVYFIYLTARVLRDFGELLLTFAYRNTPLFIVNSIMIIVVIYGAKKGIEVIARTAELNFLLIYFMAITGFILIFMSGLIDINRLKPLFGEGILIIFKVVATQTVYVPFGEMVIFSYLFPYLNHPKSTRRIGTFGILLGGINLAITMAINIAVLTAPKVENTPFPLLTTIQQIQIANFLERLDVFFLVTLFIGAFFKILLYFYVAVIATTTLFNIKQKDSIVYPLGLVVLILSITTASSYQEHIQEGLEVVPIYLHLPLQIIIPILLLGIAMVKNKRKKKNSGQKANSDQQNLENSKPSTDM
ncbi:spore germination protein [Caldibacillus lycopersici]|uniref:Spore germination protein n=1 Tax=Perspicuibacillus lycopersici TaxID=1325689 RepID=A0AAE3LPG0_9BACI|nr:spore germination protein [Perspicuibacillus lycopersici]MCU9612309.1 spore germination protein [Perspicuibacillus lycopersici]